MLAYKKLDVLCQVYLVKVFFFSFLWLTVRAFYYPDYKTNAIEFDIIRGLFSVLIFYDLCITHIKIFLCICLTEHVMPRKMKHYQVVVNIILACNAFCQIIFVERYDTPILLASLRGKIFPLFSFAL